MRDERLTHNFSADASPCEAIDIIARRHDLPELGAYGVYPSNLRRPPARNTTLGSTALEACSHYDNETSPTLPELRAVEPIDRDFAQRLARLTRYTHDSPAIPRTTIVSERAQMRRELRERRHELLTGEPPRGQWPQTKRELFLGMYETSIALADTYTNGRAGQVIYGFEDHVISPLAAIARWAGRTMVRTNNTAELPVEATRDQEDALPAEGGVLAGAAASTHEPQPPPHPDILPPSWHDPFNLDGWAGIAAIAAQADQNLQQLLAQQQTLPLPLIDSTIAPSPEVAPPIDNRVEAITRPLANPAPIERVIATSLTQRLGADAPPDGVIFEPLIPQYNGGQYAFRFEPRHPVTGTPNSIGLTICGKNLTAEEAIRRAHEEHGLDLDMFDIYDYGVAPRFVPRRHYRSGEQIPPITTQEELTAYLRRRAEDARAEDAARARM